MRMRRKKNGPQRLERCAGFWISNPTEYKNKWQSLFEKQAPLFVEIGCGKGGFITQLAKSRPECNFVAVEQNHDVLVVAAEKVREAQLDNVKLIHYDASRLPEVFGQDEAEGIYLNFCDPWHKKRHYKRRLTYKDFLDIYKAMMKKGGRLFFKTDNKMLFEFSLNQFCDYGLKLQNITLDLHNSDFKNNIMTEYEKKFFEEGCPIYRAEAVFI